MFMIWIAAAVALLFLLWIFLLAPSFSRKRRAVLREYRERKVCFAHRGLWGDPAALARASSAKTDSPERVKAEPTAEEKISSAENLSPALGYAAENSITAFRRAADAGYGIELDTRLSADGAVVVFHDDTLARITGAAGRVDELTAGELANLSLSGTGDGVPRFSEVLAAVDGRVPLLVEIKEDGFDHAVTDATAELLRRYRGPFVVESFNPFSLRRFRRQMPDVPIGLLVSHLTKDKTMRKPRYYALQWLLFNFLCRPNFLAVDKEALGFLPVCLARLFHPPLYTFTVQSVHEEKESMRRGADGIIFEKYLQKPFFVKKSK